MSSSLITFDEPTTSLLETSEIAGFLLLDRTTAGSEGTTETDFVLFDGTTQEAKSLTETSLIVTDVPTVVHEQNEEDVDEAFILAFGRGPQGPAGGPGPVGPAGPPTGEDVPDLVVYFENGLM